MSVDDADTVLRGEFAEVINRKSAANIVLVCEHASPFIPDEFGNLGLSKSALSSHIAWDPGALNIARQLSVDLDAPLVVQNASRLIFDCNRPPGAKGAIPAKSETYDIPGNIGLSDAEKQARADRFYVPFQNTLGACIDSKTQSSMPPAIITVHSFTPVYHGNRRSVEIGVLYDSDIRLAHALVPLLRADERYDVQYNDPYGPHDGVTHTLKEHAIPRGCINVMLEIRNDLVTTSASQTEMARWLSPHLKQAIAAQTGEQN
jgi:predicted N-formylglutamate amidohydrolase